MARVLQSCLGTMANTTQYKTIRITASDRYALRQYAAKWDCDLGEAFSTILRAWERNQRTPTQQVAAIIQDQIQSPVEEQDTETPQRESDDPLLVMAGLAR